MGKIEFESRVKKGKCFMVKEEGNRKTLDFKLEKEEKIIHWLFKNAKVDKKEKNIFYYSKDYGDSPTVIKFGIIIFGNLDDICKRTNFEYKEVVTIYPECSEHSLELVEKLKSYNFHVLQ